MGSVGPDTRFCLSLEEWSAVTRRECYEMSPVTWDTPVLKIRVCTVAGQPDIRVLQLWDNGPCLDTSIQKEI